MAKIQFLVKFLRDVKLRNRVVWSFVAVCLMIAVLNVLAIRPLEKAMYDVSYLHAPALNSVRMIEVKTFDAVQKSLAYLLTGDPVDKEAFLEWPACFCADMAEFHKIECQDHPGGAKGQQLVGQLAQDQKDLTAKARMLFARFEADGSVNRELVTEYKGEVRKLDSGLGELVELQQEEVVMALKNAADVQRKAVLTSYLIGFFSVALVAILGYLVSRSITTPLGKLNEAVVAFGKGETVEWPDSNGSKNEIAGLAASFKAMASDLTAAQKRQEDLVKKLRKALAEVKTLQGIIPICSFCKKIRDDQGFWNQVEVYVHQHSEVDFSHGVCPDCAKKHYPGINFEEEDAKS